MPQPPTSTSTSTPPPVQVEIARIELERYKAKLNFMRSIIVGGLVAVAIALIPPIFQYASALVEQRAKDAETAASIQKFRSEYISDFLNNALNQDIEVRIRLAEYFKFVSPDEALRTEWNAYYNQLQTKRTDTRNQIEALEKTLAAEQAKPPASADYVAQDRLVQELEWLRAEVAYVPPNRSAVRDPRNPSQATSAAPTTVDVYLDAVPADKRDIAAKVLAGFANAGLGKIQQVVALSNAIAESELDPSLENGNDVGLFQLNSKFGFGAGHTVEELKDPDTNIGIMATQSKRASAFVNATDLDTAVGAFVRLVLRPRSPGEKISQMLATARPLLQQAAP